MDLLGQIVHIEVDRPIGYRHGDIIYPVNYGYIPGVIAGDGEEQDAYILGITQPVSSFDGRVIGVIHRLNDREDKLVTAPEGMMFHQGQIAQAVHFQEQYFISTIHSLFQKSCGVIPYRYNGNKKEFLLLFQHVSQTWSFPKGHMEAGETETETALRELAEETGLQAILSPGKSATVSYAIPPHTKKEVTLFLGEVCAEPKVQSAEIETYRWVERHDLSKYLHADTAAAAEALLASI